MGNAQLLFTLRHTRVEDVRVFTDALDTDVAEDIRARLLGCRFGSERLRKRWRPRTSRQMREVGPRSSARRRCKGMALRSPRLRFS